MAITRSLRMVRKIFDQTGLNGANAGTTFFADLKDDDLGTAQFNLVSGTGTFVLQGRLADSLPWHDLIVTPLTADAISFNVPFTPQIRCNVSASTALALQCWVMD